MEAVERRALILLIPLGLVLAYNSPSYFTTAKGRWWEVGIYVIGVLCLGAAAVLVGLILAPRSIIQITLERREQLFFYATALLVAEIVSIALLRAWATYYLHRHAPSF